MKSVARAENRLVDGVNDQDFGDDFFIASYGVTLRINANHAESLDAIRKAIANNLPDSFEEIPPTEVDHTFSLRCDADGIATAHRNGELIVNNVELSRSVDLLASQIRLTVAEFAKKHVFVHAGAVSWNDRVILIPGRSFSGKTSLTAALIRRGAAYYSDEYAVLDAKGFVQPFPKPLSIRERLDSADQTEYSAEELGGATANRKSQVALVVVTEFETGVLWKPQVLQPAEGVLEVIRNTVSIRTNPEFVLNVLRKALSTAVVLKSKRGDAAACAESIVRYLESDLARSATNQKNKN